MKKILPFMITFILIMLLIPMMTFIGKKPDAHIPKIVRNQKEEKKLEEVTYYKVLNHKTNEIMELTPAQYIRGVVAAEMPLNFHIEALKAQAVASHTYTLRQIDAELSNPTKELNGAFLTTDYKKNQAFITDEELKERWGKNYDANSQKLNEAVNSVIDEVITYEGKPIIAAFHSISGGVTESAKTVWEKDVSYLVPVESIGDELSPNYETKTILTPKEVEFAFAQKYPDIKFDADKSKWFNIKNRSDSKTITEISVGSVNCTGKEVREILKLKSANFSVNFVNNSFEIVTNGYGHGVGMSQYGADYLARQGKTYDQILKYYYKDVSIEKIKPQENEIKQDKIDENK